MGGALEPADLLKEYTQLNLPMPPHNVLQNEFEKQVFMAANFFRHDPKRYTDVIKAMHDKYKKMKHPAYTASK